MKKNNYLLITVIFLTFISCNVITFGQNPIWTLPPLFLDKQLQLNSLPSTNDYTGDSATCVSNAMTDSEGNLLFFIVDGMIYDNEGYTIGDFSVENYTSYFDIKGTAEVSIVPVPENCSQFYIFLSGRQGGYSGLGTKYPVVALLDLTVQNIYHPTRQGGLIYFSNIEDLIPNGVPVIDPWGATKQGSSYFAASQENDGLLLLYRNQIKLLSPFF